MTVKSIDIRDRRFAALTERRNYRHTGFVVENRDTGEVCFLIGAKLKRVSKENYEEILAIMSEMGNE